MGTRAVDSAQGVGKCVRVRSYVFAEDFELMEAQDGIRSVIDFA